MNELEKRLERISGVRNKSDILIIPNFQNPDPNFFYFTNTNVNGIFYYDFSEPVIFTSEMEYSRAKRGWVKNVKVSKIGEIAEKTRGKRIALNNSSVSASFFSKIKGKKFDVSKDLEDARSIKTRYEISCIKKSCNISKRVFRAVEKEISRKITELELKGTVDYFIAKYGGTPSFETIVATGKNISEPHHAAANTKLGKTVLVDFGVRYKGYVSDVTRTLGSRYESVLKNAIEEAVGNIKIGVKANLLDRAARKSLGKLSRHFITGLGHGIGIAVHEKPAISSSSSDTIKGSMAITIEPGIYVADGIRLENDYVITNNGPRLLTDF